MIGELDGLAFIEARGWPYRRHGDELETTCPFCKKPRHLYLNAVSGLWKCQRCAAGGNLHQLRERLGLSNTHGVQSFRQALGTQPKRMPRSQVDAMHQALLADVEALSYCTQVRRWSLDVIKRMKIGLRLDQRGKWLAFPWWRRGEPAGMKYRILPAFEQAVPDRFEREAGYESILFNVDALDRDDEVILASGESDALALLTMGFENVVAMTTGESSLPASAVDALAQKRRGPPALGHSAPAQKGGPSGGKRTGLAR